MAPRNKREDRISKFPDNILAVHILSRLPTLDAVRTCVLSKRWIYLWTHITNLHFDINYYFRNLVSMVLLRLNTLSIESFSLSTDLIDDPSVFKTWFPALANRSIKDLTFLYNRDPDEKIFISSCYIFSCPSLVSLHLDNCEVIVPNYVHLPNLQTLQLSQIQFSPETSGNFEEIIRSFPVLKKLEFYDTFWSDVPSVRFEVPLLERVEIEETDSFDHCTINLCTSCLTYFSFDGHPSHHYNVLSELPSDVNAYVRIGFHELDGSEEERKQWGIQACILLKQLNMNLVNCLGLASTKVFSFAKESFANLPSFNMLSHLFTRKVGGEMLAELLLKSPYLTSLTIEMEHLQSCHGFESEVEHCKNDHAKQLLEFGIVPDCIRNTLDNL